MVEVISSLEPDGRRIPYDIRMGVWVTVEGETEYIRNCFEEYNAHTDPSRRYFTLYKRWHLIGLEVGMSVASVALRGEATGVANCWNADVVTTAKRDLLPGEVLDGEGGYTVWEKVMPVERSLSMGGLPLGATLGLSGALVPSHALRDASVHAIALGFVFAMVFGHAPIIFPAVLRVRIPYSPILYLPLVVLHASLALRFGGSFAESLALRQQGASLNALSLVLFIAAMIASAFLGKTGMQAKHRRS